jgi:hypothetical protein
MKTKIFFLILTLIVCGLFKTENTWAQKLTYIEKTYEGTSQLVNPIQAKKEILEKANAKIASDMILDMIGSDKYQKNLSQVKKIIIQSSKYIPFSKTSDLTKEGDLSKMVITLSVSLEDLRFLLKESGLLKETELSPTILPIYIVKDDLQTKTSAWWMDGVEDSQTQFLNGLLRSVFKKSSFNLVNLTKSGVVLPETLKKATLGEAEYLSLSQMYKAPFVLVGEVKIEKVVDADPMVGTKTVAQLNWKILEVNTFKNNLPSRMIGEVSRKIDLDTQDYLKSFHKKIQEQGEAFAQDLIAQLTEMWSRGTLGANVVQIRLMRHLPIENLEKIKNSLIAITRDIKTVKERRITSNYVVFEVETSASAESLGSKLQRVDLSGYKFVLQNVQNNELFFRFIQ